MSDNAVTRGTKGTIEGAEIFRIYDYILKQTSDGYAKFRVAVEAYSGGGKLLSYQAQTIQYTNSDGQRREVFIPEMVYIGYTDAEQKWIDEFYVALEQRVRSGDEQFINSTGVQELLNASPGERTVYSLRAPKDIRPDDPSKGVGPVMGVDGNSTHESVVVAQDLADRARSTDKNLSTKLTSSRHKAEFLSRVVHEQLHKRWLHNTYAFEQKPGAKLADDVIANINKDFTLQDLRALDQVYAETRNVLVELTQGSSNPFKVSAQEFEAVYRDATEAVLGGARQYRVKEIYKNTRFLLKNGMEGDFTPEQLKFLDREGVIKLKPLDPSQDTPEGRAQHGTREEHYEEDTRYIRNLSKEYKDEISKVSYTAAREGGDFTLREAVDSALFFAREFFAEYSSEIGQSLGSALGRQIARNSNPGVQLAASTVIGVVGQNFGELIEFRLRGATTDASAVLAFRNIDVDLLRAGKGAISSFLTAQLLDELGLTSKFGGLGDSVATNTLTAIIQNLPGIIGGTVDIGSVIGMVNPFNLIGAYYGARLGAEVFEADTLGGQIGASVGTSVGAIAGTATALQLAGAGAQYGAILGPIGALAGAFIGYIAGGLLGSLFGGTPRSGADVAWDGEKFAITRVWSKHGGSKEAARSVAMTVVEITNGFIETIGAQLASVRGVRIGNYGLRGKNYYYQATGGEGAGRRTFTSRNAQDVINHGTAIALHDLLPRMIGGDLFAKRAAAATLAGAGGNPASNFSGAAGSFDTNVLLGNLSTARDYAAYLADRTRIDTLIAASPNSSFAAGWVVTLARAAELGLGRRSVTDWAGGWNAYIDQRDGGVLDGRAFNPATASFTFDRATQERLTVFRGAEGEIVSVAGDTIDGALKDTILGTSGADTILVTGDRIGNSSGLMINGAAPSASSYTIQVSARIDGGIGSDTIIGGNLGNDLIGDDGNDTLVGGDLDDWLLGGAGNDRLFAGASGYQFADGDEAASIAALNVVGNGDMLDGGDGSDWLYGSRGSDWLRGGAGVDTLLGGAGGDIIDGGAGDDRGASGEARLLGGAGTDQYIFNYGDGKDVAFDESDTAIRPGSVGDSLYARMRGIDQGTIKRNWAGDGEYELDGSVKGGEDTIAFGVGIDLEDLVLQRSGTAAAPGQDLIISLTAVNASGARVLTGDELVIKDWFETTRRVEWLRFADGQEIRIGDVSSFIVGTGGADIIFGTNGADFIVGGAGDDTIRGLNGDDFGFGGQGKDLIAGDGDNDLVSGGDDDDNVIGGAGNDTVFGDAGNDMVYGDGGSDIVVGGRGDDAIIGGDGDDIFRYQRGDGRDVLIDALVNNWDLVWRNGVYINGYSLDITTGVVSKDGEVVFDGNQWLGTYDYDDSTRTFRRHLGEVNGAIAGNSGTDFLEFGVGIDIQDLMFGRIGSHLQIAIGRESDEERGFDAATDSIMLGDWYLTGNAIESFVFASTGIHDIRNWTLTGGTDDANTIVGTTGIDWITGNGGDDTITGGAGEDILNGNGGGDLLRGEAGVDVLFGGSGDDVLDGGAGADEVLGGSGVDIASYATASGTGLRASLTTLQINTGDAAGDVYSGIEGLEGSAGADTLYGDSDSNVLRGLGGNDVLYGGASDDIYEFDASHGQDTINDAPFALSEVVNVSGAFNSAQYTARWTYLGFLGTAMGSRHCYQLVITSNATGQEVYRSRDQVDFTYTTDANRPMPVPFSWPAQDGQWRNGAARTDNGFQVAQQAFSNENGGSDTIEFGAGISLSDLTFQRLHGNADLRIDYPNGSFVTIVGQGEVNRAIETLQLSDGLSADLGRLVLTGQTASSAADFLAGDANANTLAGLAGDDVLSGAAGNDTLQGGDGDDSLEGGLGSDVLDGGADSLTAGLAINSAGSYGDTIRYVSSNTAVSIDLAARTASGGHATGDTIAAASGVSTIENVVGSNGFGDTLRGDARGNRLFGLGGTDTLEGQGGNDVLVGGAGNDTLRGGVGEDNLTGDEGNDILEGGADKDLLAGGAGDDRLSGEAGADVLSGGEGADVLSGGTEDDQLGGEAGDDQLNGDAGNDQIAGGEGNDTLTGGDGNDSLAGEGGNDTLLGGFGNDTYLLDAASGLDSVVDDVGVNRVAIAGATRDQIWITNFGNDLRIGIIGTETVITIAGYHASSNETLMHEIMLTGQSLFLSAATPLIAAMTNSSIGTPDSMPEDIATLLAGYWHANGKAAPTVVDQIRTTNEDVALTGVVDAQDHDFNIVSYEVVGAAARGSVSVNATSGVWVYTPGANLYGSDSFQIRVTDADNQSAVQTVRVQVASVNDAPHDIELTGAPASIAERDRPQSGTILNAIILGTLSAKDVDFPDAGDFASFVFSTTDARFEIVDGNVLRLRAGVALDFEATPTVSVAIKVTDRNGTGLSFTKTFTFAVADRDDYFYGTVNADTITGQAGRNLIFGQGGNDTLTGANANDDLDGGDGGDLLSGLGGNDTLLGGLGEDTLDGGAGADVLRGGDGIDTLRGQDGDDQLFGDAGNDTLQGGIGNDQLDGGADNDRLEGGDGADRLVGGTGDDLLIGGAGADRFLGGTGFDTVSYEAATAAVKVNVTSITGSAGDALGDVFEDAPERLIGSAFADTITGSSGDDRLEGGAGDDIINGGLGDDTLMGGAGNDTLDAQAGNDMLMGGAGSDILIGGDDSDTYMLDVNSGADEIRNFDPNGTDIDVVGYDGITRNQLWFQRSGNNLVVYVVGTSVVTTIKDWYLMTSASDRSNYKIDFFLASEHVTRNIDAEGLVTLMAGYTRPTTQAAFDALLANSTFSTPWSAAWRVNAAPTVPVIADQTINEDGTLTLTVKITDDVTPASGISVTVDAVDPDNPTELDSTIVNSATLSTANSAGERTLTVTTRPNASGRVGIRITATDAGGLSTERVVELNVAPVADAPEVTVAAVVTPVIPLTKPTLDSGSLAIDVQAALVDKDGSETLEVSIANVPNGITFSAGTNAGGGVWRFSPAQLVGLKLMGAATWSDDLTLSVTAISKESATGATATSAAVELRIPINARPTDITADVTPAIDENVAAGATIAQFSAVDADSGDTKSFSLVGTSSNFSLSSTGALTSRVPLNFEEKASHDITVRVTDSGGLTYDEVFTVRVNNVQEAPTAIRADRALRFSETRAITGLANFSGDDPENNISSWSLVNSANGRFSISSGGLLSTAGAALDYEGATFNAATGTRGYSITVRATDTTRLTRDETFFVSVDDVNEAPTLSGTSATVFEGANGGPGNLLTTTGGSIVQVSGSDPEGAALRYELVGGDWSMFSVDSLGRLRQQGELDFESRTSYSVTVRAYDAAVGGNYADATVSISVANVNEAPRITGFTSVGTTSTGFGNGVIVHLGMSVVDPEGDALGSPTGAALGDSNLTPTVDSIFISVRPNELDGSTRQITVRDVHGAATTQTIQLLGTPPRIVVLGPVVLDLDGNGIELVPRDASTVSFDMDGNGGRDATGWVGAGDGMLVLDRNGDGAITSGAEISFTQDAPHAMSDLEGLAAFDTNADGYFGRGDARYGDFRVWRDANQDGVSQAGELLSLADRGITAISLTRSATGASAVGATDNVIVATSDYVRSDGSVAAVGVADAWLAYTTVDVQVTFLGDAGSASTPLRDMQTTRVDVGQRRGRRARLDGADLWTSAGQRTDGSSASALATVAQSTDAPASDARPVDQVDRGSNDAIPSAMAANGRGEQPDTSSLKAPVRREASADEPATQWPVADDADVGFRPQRPAAKRMPWPSLDSGTEEVDASQDVLPVASSALHAPLASISRRRLQMIEAMAGFAAEGGVELSLQPGRRVDARTLELLTSLPTVKVA